MLKTIQVQTNNKFGDLTINNLLKSAGVKRIHNGWYSLWYDGMSPNYLNVVKAKRNPSGKIK